MAPVSKSEMIHPACRDFVAVLEQLLERRQREAQQASPRSPAWRQDNWGPRTWTRTELEDMVYSSYKQMRQGRITRPPRRETVMEIADYLDCTLEERNRLLIAAHATPMAPYLTGEPLEAAVQIAIGVAQTLALPVVVINRDWHIHYLNEHMIRLYGVTPEQFAAVAPEQFNILHLLFDPQLPLYPNLSQNRESWTRMVRQTIYGFKLANLLCEFEPWYQALLSQLMTLPEFESHWRAVRVDSTFDLAPGAQTHYPAILLDTLVPNTLPHPKHARLHPLLISVGYFQFDFPQIVAFLPADPESRAIFGELGLPLPGGA